MLEYISSVNDLMEHDDYVNFMGCNIMLVSHFVPKNIYIFLCTRRQQSCYIKVMVLNLVACIL